VLEGTLFHQDSTGNTGTLCRGDIQLMSAGKGIHHAETNPSQFDTLKGLQIWLSPKIRDTFPQYQQRHFKDTYFTNQLGLIFSQNPVKNVMSIKLDAKLYRALSSKKMLYTVATDSKENGFYIFIIEGTVSVNSTMLHKGDGLGVSETKSIEIQANEKSDFLLFEIPMIGDF
jgi:redox-sensitive bicupin YhaK (pirin superfamily)